MTCGWCPSHIPSHESGANAAGTGGRHSPEGRLSREECVWHSSFPARSSFMPFVRKSLERHVSLLGNESCFRTWRVWFQQARGKVPFIASCWQMEAEGGHPKTGPCCGGRESGCGREAGGGGASVVCSGQEARGSCSQNASQGRSRAASWELGPRKGKASGDRKDKEERQKLCF